MSKIHSVGKTKLLGRIDAISKQNVCRVRVGVGATGTVSSKMSELGENTWIQRHEIVVPQEPPWLPKGAEC